MTREELLNSNEYWVGEIQHSLFKLIKDYMDTNKFSRKELADRLGVTKGYISQILNGEFDHRISKLVELAMIIGKVPRIDYIDIDQIKKLDELGELHKQRYDSINIELKLDPNSGISAPVPDTKS